MNAGEYYFHLPQSALPMLTLIGTDSAAGAQHAVFVCVAMSASSPYVVATSVVKKLSQAIPWGS
jgi:hypothetical protein